MLMQRLLLSFPFCGEHLYTQSLCGLEITINIHDKNYVIGRLCTIQYTLIAVLNSYIKDGIALLISRVATYDMFSQFYRFN